MKRSIVKKRDRLFLTKFANYKDKKKQMIRKMKNIRKITMAALVAFSVVIAGGCTKSDDPNNGGGGNNGGGNGGGTYNGHEYVDLGLPSGTLWATCNVGATSPEEYGDYFAWGETQPKDTYNWSTYQYCMGSDHTLTMYCTDTDPHFHFGYNGFYDDLTTLLPEDDVATANWGSGWRMPTRAQWEELYVNAAYTWTTRGGVHGRLFTASNGNSLFLPAAGYRSDVELKFAGIGGYYWSSSLYDCPVYAMGFLFGVDVCFVLNGNRDTGRSVRPVRSARQN